MERRKSKSLSGTHEWSRQGLMLAVAALWLCPAALGQAQSPAASPFPSAEQIIQRDQDPFSGSTTQGKLIPGVMELTIQDALERGLKYNLGLYLSERATEETRSSRLKALSDLLPQVNGALTEEEQRINLKAFGFNFPGFPSAVGPFGLTELTAAGTWTPLNLHYLSNLRSASENVKSAQFTYRDARDTVVLAVGANYLLTIANESRVTAAQAELDSAQALYNLAVDEENAGITPNIDTLRARVQLQTQQSLLIQAQNDLEKQRISLARVIGLPVQQKFQLVNRVPYHPLPEAVTENAVARALATRPDYQAALASLRAAKYSRDSAWQQRVPSIGFTGNYGVLGYNFGSVSPNWMAEATLSIPIFEGGKIQADVQQADSVLKQRQAQVDNLRGAIEQQIQNSLLDLKAAAEQVQVATIGLDYAQQALQQSRDRFAAGVTNNVEVIQAQQQLASANEQYIGSLYGYNIAKVLLARAIGNAEQAVTQYLSEPGNLQQQQTPPPSATPNPAQPDQTVTPNAAAPNQTVTPSQPDSTVTPNPAQPANPAPPDKAPNAEEHRN